MHFLTTVPLKLENAKQRRTYKERRPNPLGVSHCFNVFRNGHRVGGPQSIFYNFAALGRCLVPFWCPLDFEGVPKVGFFIESQHKMRKVRSNNGVWKNNIFYVFLMPKWEAWNGKQKFSHYTCWNLRGLTGRENWLKMELQQASQINQNW